MQESKIIKITEPPEKQVLEKIANVLSRGGIIAFPTETVYGIGCLLSREETRKRIYFLKGRGFDKPLAVYLSSVETLRSQTGILKPAVEVLVKTCLPGPLTLVLNDKNGNKTGYRISPEPVLIALLDILPEPVVGTSANKSGEKDSTTAEEVMRSVGSGLDIIIDAGPRKGDIPSTVVDCSGNKPVVLREGAIRASVIARLTCGL